MDRGDVPSAVRQAEILQPELVDHPAREHRGVLDRTVLEQVPLPLAPHQRPTGDVVLLDHDDVEAGPRQVGGADQAVVAAADDHDIDALTGHVTPFAGGLTMTRNSRTCSSPSMAHR